MNEDRCMNAGNGTVCQGALSVRFSDMGTRLCRCAAHWRRRDEVEDEIRELTSPLAPAWFDPGDAGEAWDNDEGTGLE